jgi:general secretion pathway protein M
MIEKLANWFEALSLREKVLVGVAAILSVLLVAIYGVYFPLTTSIQEKRVAYREALERRVAVEAMVAQPNQKPRAAAVTATSGPLEQVVNQRATEAGFALEKADAAGNGRVAIAMAQARPAALMKWLAELELEGVVAEQIEVKAGSAGTVSVSATLARGGQ